MHGLFPFDNTYARDLEGLYVRWKPARVPTPGLVWFNRALAEELGLDVDAVQAQGAGIFSGDVVPDGASPIAQAYAGHQFGHLNPQLGDGRALLLGEVVDRRGQRRDVAFKGSGPTPFSRGGDGKAALGPVLREVILGEAMHALGVPTTRALAAATTGEVVRRDRPLQGAVLTRVAASHLRVGTFVFFAVRHDVEKLGRLLDYALQRHDPGLLGQPDKALLFLDAALERQASLIARWMHLGFIHGVMNTDNMALSGETIDYGPCAFMEGVDPDAVFSSIDHAGRYAWGNQPTIAAWNLTRLAEALLPLIDPDPDAAVARATAVLETFPARYQHAWLALAGQKLGISAPDEGDRELAEAWLSLLAAQSVDHTLGWRRLADAAAGDEAPLRALFRSPAALDPWLARWRTRVDLDAAAMRAVSPIYIPRNQRVEEALTAAEQGDLGPFERLLEVVTHPWEERAELAAYAAPAPVEVTACYRTFCGT